MAYVKNADLTDAYIQSLITRAGFTDVTALYYDASLVGTFYMIRDLNGVDTDFSNNRSGVRDFCINQYVIQQNS